MIGENDVSLLMFLMFAVNFHHNSTLTSNRTTNGTTTPNTRNARNNQAFLFAALAIITVFFFVHNLRPPSVDSVLSHLPCFCFFFLLFSSLPLRSHCRKIWEHEPNFFFFPLLIFRWKTSNIRMGTERFYDFDHNSNTFQHWSKMKKKNTFTHIFSLRLRPNSWTCR